MFLPSWKEGRREERRKKDEKRRKKEKRRERKGGSGGRKEEKTHEAGRAIGENTGVNPSDLNEALSSGPSYLPCSFTHTVEWTRLTVLSDRGAN